MIKQTNSDDKQVLLDEGTVHEISSNLPIKKLQARFTTVPFTTLIIAFCLLIKKPKSNNPFSVENLLISSSFLNEDS